MENIKREPEILESAEPEAVEAPESQEPADAEPPVPPTEPTPAAAPAPKKRGRPPKVRVEAPPPAPKVRAAPKPKAVRKPRAPPVEDSSDSSDIDDTLRNVYNHVAKPDMETAVSGQSKAGREHPPPRAVR